VTYPARKMPPFAESGNQVLLRRSRRRFNRHGRGLDYTAVDLRREQASARHQLRAVLRKIALILACGEMPM
jgi:hypothetical protein